MGRSVRDSGECGAQTQWPTGDRGAPARRCRRSRLQEGRARSASPDSRLSGVRNQWQRSRPRKRSQRSGQNLRIHGPRPQRRGTIGRILEQAWSRAWRRDLRGRSRPACFQSVRWQIRGLTVIGGVQARSVKGDLSGAIGVDGWLGVLRDFATTRLRLSIDTGLGAPGVSVARAWPCSSSFALMSKVPPPDRYHYKQPSATSLHACLTPDEFLSLDPAFHDLHAALHQITVICWQRCSSSSGPSQAASRKSGTS